MQRQPDEVRGGVWPTWTQIGCRTLSPGCEALFRKGLPNLQDDALRTLYVATHPESVHHASGHVGGWFDSELTDRGLRQAELIGQRIRDLIPSATAVELYSSDLKRTAQTAEVIARHLNVVPTFLEGLREKSYGEAEGRPQAWLDERFRPPPATGDRMGHAEGITGSETKRDFAACIYDAVNTILESSCPHQVVHGQDRTTDVGHGLERRVATVEGGRRIQLRAMRDEAQHHAPTPAEAHYRRAQVARPRIGRQPSGGRPPGRRASSTLRPDR